MVVVGNGGSVLLYVIGHDKEVTRKIVEFLQQWDLAGVISTRESMPGRLPSINSGSTRQTLPTSSSPCAGPSDTNQSGVAGMITSDTGGTEACP